MITVAFAGQYPTLTNLVNNYTHNKIQSDLKYRTMTDNQELKVLTKDPYNEKNYYQWTRSAQCIFVCVNANDEDFLDHFVEEIRSGNFNDDLIVLVAIRDVLDGDVFEKFQSFAQDQGFPAIYCSSENNQAHYIKRDTILVNQDLMATLDMASNDMVAYQAGLKRPSQVRASVQFQDPDNVKRRRRCDIL